MKYNYQIFFIYEDKQDLCDNILNSIKREKELRFKELHFTIKIDFYHNSINLNLINGPSLAIFLCSDNAGKSDKCKNQIEIAFNAGIYIIPVIEDPENFRAYSPDILHSINVFIWSDSLSEQKLSQKVFEGLGITEKDRRVFISYKRSDALVMADQLYAELTLYGFNVFLDKYNIDIGRDFQKEIYESIDDKAFLLVIESPEAYKSKWITKEINYALRSNMALLIISWPNNPTMIDATNDLERFFLNQDDLSQKMGYNLIKSDILKNLLLKIESCHAYGLLRRRRNLIMSLELEMKPNYEICAYIDKCALILRNSKNGLTDRIVSITPRIPKPKDLYDLDSIPINSENPNDNILKILYHQAISFPTHQKEVLNWILNRRKYMEIKRYIS